MSAPLCPVKGCGCRLVETTGPWRDRGDWMCHGEHDGKRIWYSLELIQILEAKLASAEKRVKELEGLPVGEGIYDLRGGTLLTIKLPAECEAKAVTLGEAMLRKDGAVYCTDPDHCTYADCPTAFCDRDKAIPRNG